MVLSARQVAVWRGERCLCEGLDFDLRSGEALHIQGANGAGKTSLIRVLTGLGRCDAGQVLWQSRELRHWGSEYRAALAYIGHNNGVKLGLSPRENLLATAALAQGASAGEVDAALEQMELRQCAELPCASLSMGQRRRTALARLLLVQVPLWFLDEPLASLDVSGVGWLAGLVTAHLANGGLAIYATHQPMDLAPFNVRTLALGHTA